MSKPKRYDPAAIETKWQSRWENEKTYACHVDKDKKKYYVLEMFPYPSGNLHMGHVRNYSIGDVVARFKRMQGFNVMHPMGWDAFGLPAENAAIKHNIHPSVWTHANIDNMRAQLKRLGYSYDWDREVATCDEPYYRWEQLFFLRWLEKGLVYRKKASQNWCPHCNTVLANEQVVDGLCWRCDTPVVQKELTQWFLKITDYADELLADLSKLEGGWPDRVLSMQRNWIGKSVGAEITFPLESGEGDIKVFTTRPDTVFGVTFMTLAPSIRSSSRSSAASPTKLKPAPLSSGPTTWTASTASPTASKKKASSPAPTASTPSRAVRFRSGSATSSLPNTAPARLWPCPPTTSATSTSPRSTAWSASWLSSLKAKRRSLPKI